MLLETVAHEVILLSPGNGIPNSIHIPSPIPSSLTISCLFHSCLLYLKQKFLCHAVFTEATFYLDIYISAPRCTSPHLPHPTPEPEPCVYNCLPAPMTAVVETLAETGKVQTITIFLLLLLLDWLSCKHCSKQATSDP